MPVIAATREYVITYNDVSVSPHGYPSFTIGKDRATLCFDVLVYGTTQATFASAVGTFETAYRTPFQALTVTIGGNSLLSASQSANTALDPIASVEVIGGAPDSGLGRMYRVRIEYGVPASLGGGGGGTTGLRDAVTTLSYTPAGRASVTMRGTFTAVGANDAKAVHDAAIGAYASAMMTYLGITPYQLVGRPSLDISLNKKTADFARVYEEIFATQAIANTVIRQIFTVTRGRRGSDYVSQTSGSSSPVIGGSSSSHGSGNIGNGPGDYPAPPDAATTEDVVPLTEVTVTYEAWIDKAATTDLVTAWATIEDWAIDQLPSILGTDSFGLMSSSPRYERDDNKIVATITALIADVDGSGLIANVFEQSFQVQPGYDTLPVWTDDPLAKIVWRGAETLTRTTTRRWRVAGGTGTSPTGGFPAGGPKNAVAGPNAGGAGGATQWFPMSNIGTADNPMSRTIGIGRKPFLVLATEYWYTMVEFAATPIN